MKRRVALDVDGRVKDVERDPRRREWEVRTALQTLEAEAGRVEELSRWAASERPFSERWWRLLRRLDEANGAFIHHGGSLGLEAVRGLWQNLPKSG
jgi:hypothetical protein